MRSSILLKFIVIFSLEIFLLSPACGKKEKDVGKTAGNHPPVAKAVKVEPAAPSGQDTLKASVEGQDADGDQITYSYQWLLNGNAITGETREEISAQGFSPEDKIAVRVTPADGKEEGKPVASDPVQVKNSPPIITQVNITPDPANITSTLKAEVVGADPDNDRIDLSFQWFKDGNEIPGQTGGTLDPSFLEKGKAFLVKVLPSDLYGKGEAKSSSPRTIENVPPKITSSPPVVFDQGIYRYPVKVEDPDSQEFTFILKQAPEGMRISPEGVIEWTPKPDQTGSFTVEIRVEDKDGGWATQSSALTIQATK